MAAAFLEKLAGGRVEVDSAGTQPSDAVNPVVVEVMREKGIDVSDNNPKLLTQDMVDESDKVITMGCSIEEACSTVFVPSEDWGLGGSQRPARRRGEKNPRPSGITGQGDDSRAFPVILRAEFAPIRCLRL